MNGDPPVLFSGTVTGVTKCDNKCGCWNGLRIDSERRAVPARVNPIPYPAFLPSFRSSLALPLPRRPPNRSNPPIIPTAAIPALPHKANGAPNAVATAPMASRPGGPPPMARTRVPMTRARMASLADCRIIDDCIKCGKRCTVATKFSALCQ